MAIQVFQDGALVEYNSVSQKQWIPAQIESHSRAHGTLTYKLKYPTGELLRETALPSQIRTRVIHQCLIKTSEQMFSDFITFKDDHTPTHFSRFD